MSRFRLTPAAKTDLAEISDYIARDSPRAAKRVRGELRAAMARLAEMPTMGHLREDLTSAPVRFWSVYSYLIVYRPDTRPIQVLRVVHGARDVKRILAGERS